MHPIAQAVVAALDDAFPPVDGRWTRVPLWRPGLEGVVAMTGHAFVAVGDDVTDTRLDELGADGFGGAADARFTVALAGTGYLEVHDLLLARRAERTPAPQRCRGPTWPTTRAYVWLACSATTSPSTGRPTRRSAT
ncbi:hypothetical protein [Barrientosiimonas endolithica]|uniref:Uncharacterized protein n=1 Tax=Barrientosiimonas endolithica TaxID=1535208 RepID=A0ABM8H848_9MICO|nr:hypothetical protein [Barrientosiimonas endolithica]BDZ57041.1 hypothetical protein GCM10025872_06980 [Barrientosiimonas endolithica]